MDFVIPSDKLNSLIKEFILNSYPEVYDVQFTIKRVVLGIKGGSHDKTTIRVIIGNFENKIGRNDLRNLANSIKYNTDLYFSLNYRFYGSQYDIEVDQLAVVPLNISLQ